MNLLRAREPPVWSQGWVSQIRKILESFTSKSNFHHRFVSSEKSSFYGMVYSISRGDLPHIAVRIFPACRAVNDKRQGPVWCQCQHFPVTQYVLSYVQVSGLDYSHDLNCARLSRVNRDYCDQSSYYS